MVPTIGVAVLVCVVTAIVWWLFRRSTAQLRSSVNLPPPVVQRKRPKKIQPSQLPRQTEARDALVLFGTTTGTSWQYAEQLVREGSRLGLSVRSASLEDFDFESELHLESAVVVIVPTYDGGTPNATTRDFYDFLSEAATDFRVDKALLERVSFAVFGLGDTVYGDNFCAVGRKVDEWLRVLGGNRLLARGSGDAQYASKQFGAWLERLWPSLLAALGEKDKLADLRRARQEARAATAAGASSLRAYQSDDDEDDEKEPLGDVEDLAAAGASAGGGEDDEGSASEDDEPVPAAGEPQRELLTPSLTAALSKQGYQLIGTHSGVKLCRWTKAMLRGRGGCYKHTFYNIASYQCMEMTPSLACANKCVFCVAEGSLVTLASGVSVPIEQMGELPPEARFVHALGPDGSGTSAQLATAFTDVGVRECVELLLCDGRTIVTTPDHRIRAGSDWIEAGSLRVGVRVSAGVEFAASAFADSATSSDWALQAGPLALGQRSVTDRVRTGAFMRILGYVRSEKSGDGQVCLRHPIDVASMRADCLLLTDEAPSVTHEASSARFAFPCAVRRALQAVDCHQSVPDFLLSPECPLDVVREFLGGLFGGGGGTTVSVACDQDRARFGPVVFATGGRELVAQQLLSLLQRAMPTVELVVEPDRVTLPTSFTLAFARSVGFRHSCHKQIRLTAAAAYYRAKDLVSRQRQWLVDRVAELERLGGEKRLLQTAKSELAQRELLYERSVTVKGMLDNLGIAKFFEQHSSSKRAKVESHATEEVPLFFAEVVGMRRVGPKRVFDVTVPLPNGSEGSFLANGVVVHNCWRHGKNPVAKEWKWKMDEPEFLIEQSVEKHRAMIRQCKGVPGVVPERYEEALNVRHCALSLVGEPIIYPQINRFVELLHARRISSFMVTNAQFPKELEKLRPVTQVYLSIDAATPESLRQIDRPVHPDYWERFLASIDVLRNKRQRTVFRLTLVKEWNMEEMQDYAKLIERGMPEFIEVKGVTYCGNNKTSSLTIKNTPYHEEVCEFVKRLAVAANDRVGQGTYELCAAHEHSVCFLIAHTKFRIGGEWHTFIDYDRFFELDASGQPFGSLDYVAKTPGWALYGSPERGFDPEETRVFRKGKEGKRERLYANQGC